MENDEKLADKLMSLIRNAVRVPTSGTSLGNFKRLSGLLCSLKKSPILVFCNRLQNVFFIPASKGLRQQLMSNSPSAQALNLPMKSHANVHFLY